MDWSPESRVLWRPFWFTCQKISVYKCSKCNYLGLWHLQPDVVSPHVLWLISGNWVTFYIHFKRSFLHLPPPQNHMSSCFNIQIFSFSFILSLASSTFLFLPFSDSPSSPNLPFSYAMFSFFILPSSSFLPFPPFPFSLSSSSLLSGVPKTAPL